MRCCSMGDPIRTPAKSRPATQARTSRAPMRPGQARLDQVYPLVDFILARLLVLAVTLAILRGQVTTELVAAIWASYCLLRATQRK